MNHSEQTVRRLTDKERIAKVQSEKRRTAYQLTTLSIVGIMAFLLIWQLAVYSGLLSSRYVPMPSDVIRLLFEKWSDSRG